MKVDLAIIGGGPAGMAAAIAAYDKGVSDIVIIERDNELGGILNQCIHHGFGLHTFNEELTGPEYALRYIEMVIKRRISCLLLTMAVNIITLANKKHLITVRQGLDENDGLFNIEAKAVIFAMGCRERPRGALNIPGFRPSGIYTAGCAQRFVNIEGYMPGCSVVVLGSGDIGLIMARRMKLQGADVKMVVEIMPYSGGLKRNIVQCLEDYNIPLKISHTVIDIDGRSRLKGVTVAAVDSNLKPLLKTAEYIPCDTLLISCGLIPENELTALAAAEIDNVTGGPVVNENLETTVRGIFACGNVLHVHDLVDNVSAEAVRAGMAAADYLLNSLLAWGNPKRPKIPPKSRYIPAANRDYKNQLICIGCPVGCLITVENYDEKLPHSGSSNSLQPLLRSGCKLPVDSMLSGAISDIKISGNACPAGLEYARKEIEAPSRSLTSLVRVSGGKKNVVSVKTAADIPKGKIFDCMREIRKMTVNAPVNVGDILIKNVADTGVDIVATTNCPDI